MLNIFRGKPSQNQVKSLIKLPTMFHPSIVLLSQDLSTMINLLKANVRKMSAECLLKGRV